jgi:transcriptional regulator with GAF, ATPase, and Fis domain
LDYNKFFRKATLAICGDLRIERAMRDCVVAIKDHIPVERMVMLIYEPELYAMRTLAFATSETGELRDMLTPLPKEAREKVHRNLTVDLDGAVIINDPEENPVAKEMLRAYGIEGWSVMRMTLTTEAGKLGQVAVSVKGLNRYEEEHGKLFTLLQKPFAIALANTLRHREVLRLRDHLADDNLYLHRELQRISGDEIIGADFGLKDVMRLVRQVAPTESPVLLDGETGVGKDVIANAIHLGSPRRDGPFIAVNCGAIPETLMDSELFGHEKGSFTGAISRKRGRFERAHKGTIFLDEIGEMPLNVQVRLLRVIQNHEIERVGGTERIPVDIRIVAATNKELQEAIESGRFREDLWFRLNVFPITVPPLRERTGDIPALVQHFIERKTRELKLGLTPKLATGAIEDLLSYSWPGNVRELENVLERAMIIHRGEPLRFDLTTPTRRKAGQAAATDDKGNLLPLDAVVTNHIRQALKQAGGKIHGSGGAGELLEINPNTLRHKMRKLGIPFKRGA